MSPRPRPMSLDLLRDKLRAALARAATCPTPIDLQGALLLVYTTPDGAETEISEGHFLDNTKCQPGQYSVTLAGPAGFSFQGTAVLADPTGSPVMAGVGADFTRQTSSFISALLTEGRNAVEVGAQDLTKARERIRELEELTISLMRRVGELERSGGGPSETQRELVSLLTRIVSLWVGLGGMSWSAETVNHAITVLQLVQRSARVQEAVRLEDGGASALRGLLGAGA